MTKNPLAAWLEDKDLKPYQFAEMAKISLGTAYKLASDERGQKFDADTLVLVQDVTRAEVTLGDMVKWFNQKRKQ